MLVPNLAKCILQGWTQVFAKNCTHSKNGSAAKHRQCTQIKGNVGESTIIEQKVKKWTYNLPRVKISGS